MHSDRVAKDSRKVAVIRDIGLAHAQYSGAAEQSTAGDLVNDAVALGTCFRCKRNPPVAFVHCARDDFVDVDQ